MVTETRTAANGVERRIPGLDGIRGLAILGVLLLHYEARQPSPFAALRYLWGLVVGSGWAGVDLFFVLSGFLITGILLDSKSHPRYFQLFYARRTLRIFPLYYCALIVIFLVAPQLGLAPAVPASTQVWYWVYLSNVLIAFKGWGAAPPHTYHFWSLAIEEQFYLVWPAMVYVTSVASLRRICLGVMALSLTSRLLLAEHHASTTLVELLTTSRVEPLAVGAWVAAMLREEATRNLVRRASRWLAVAGAAVLLLIIVVRESVRPDDLVMATFGYSAVAWLGAAAILHVTAPSREPVGGGIFGLTPLRFLGRYSYGLYVWHYPIMTVLTQHHFTIGDLTRELGAPRLANASYVAVNLVGTLSAALLSWHFLEQPMLSLKRYFSYGVQRPTMQASPGVAVARVTPSTEV